MKKLQKIDESKLINNPFTASLSISATRVIDARKFKRDKDGVMHPAEYRIEKEEITKIFHCSGAKDLVSNLSPNASVLYLYVLYHLEPNFDYIRLNVDHYMNKRGIKSINTYKDAVKELCRYCFIAPSADYKDVYWINPMLFFSGNRLTKYPKNVTIKGEITMLK